MDTIARRIAEIHHLPTENIQHIESGLSHTIYILNNQYVLRLAQHHTVEHFAIEKNLIDTIRATVAVPHILHVGIYENEKKPIPYSIAEYIQGTPLSRAWPKASTQQQTHYMQQLAQQMRALHQYTAADIPTLHSEPKFAERKKAQVQRWLDAAKHNSIEDTIHGHLQKEFERLKYVYDEPVPHRLLHVDLNFENCIVTPEHTVVLLDFEWAMFGPITYELRTLVSFAITPQAYLPQPTAQLYTKPPLNFLLLLKEYYPELFAAENLEDHIRLYMIEALLWAWSGEGAILEKDAYRTFAREQSLALYRAVFQDEILSTIR